MTVVLYISSRILIPDHSFRAVREYIDEKLPRDLRRIVSDQRSTATVASTAEKFW